MGSFWSKYMFEPQKRRELFWWHWRLMQNLKKNWLALSKMTWRILQIFRALFISYDKQVFLGVTSQCDLPSCTHQKMSSSPLQFGQEENIPGRSIERRAYWFILKIVRMFSIPTSRNRMMNTFIIVNIIHSYKRFPNPKKAFLLPSVWPGTEYTLALIWKTSLLPLICFQSYQGIPYSHRGRVDRSLNTLPMVNISPIYKR